MRLLIEPFDSRRDSEEWDALCARAPMATFLHTRRFLAYHGERFEDHSCVARDASGRLLAVFPAARVAENVVSHPGATFGGIVHDGSLLGESLLQTLSDMAAHYAARGFRLLRYKAVPHIYQRWPSQDDLYALFRLGARRYRCDLSSTIDLAAQRPLSERRRRSLRKAKEAQIQISREREDIAGFWAVLCDTLQRRHGAKPVHTLEEIRVLMASFASRIELVTARVNDRLEAGVLLFDSPCVSHAQYIASTEAGNDCNALDAIFEHCLELARDKGCRYFDFGISTEDEGRRLNGGLYDFKSGFGGGGTAYEFHELSLTGA